VDRRVVQRATCCVERPATDQHQRAHEFGMRRRKCQPEHRAPRPTNDGRRRVHRRRKIGDVLRDRQRFSPLRR